MSANLEDYIASDAAIPQVTGRSRFIVKTAAFALEIGIVGALLFWWLSSDSVQESQNLWVFFFYCFPSEFLIATVPHEPALLYFAKFYHPLTLALVAIAGTALTEVLNYSVFKYVADLRLFRKMLANKAVGKMVALFNRAPFTALWIAGFTPIPFYPFRFLVVLAHYPLSRYILAVVLSRTPRFYLYALLGQAIRISDYLLLLFTAILIIAANVPIVIKLIKGKSAEKQISQNEATEKMQ
jgi:membrane protein YqaA with SNARE-associated domain